MSERAGAEKAAKPEVKVRIYKLRNVLKDKVGGLDLSEIAIDEGALEAAEKMFLEMAEDYPDWVTRLLDELADHHRRCVDTPAERRMLFEKITAIAHDMKGQGGTFGYPLVTRVAASLDRFSSRRTDIRDHHVEIIKAHIDAMRAVIRDRVKGDGGEIGRQLVESLEQAIDRYSPKGR